MSYEKVIETYLFGVTNQNSALRMTAGDSSAGTFTSKANPLRGTLVWDRCMYVLHGVSVAGGATGGSYTITIQTDAVRGYTALPIASAAIGPLTPKTVVLSSLHHSPGSPLPTHIFVDQTAAGGGIWFQCHALAKQYRGAGTPGVATAERIIAGTMVYGTSHAKQFATDAGISADVTLVVGTSAANMGMNKMRLWDTAFYWATAGVSVAGTFDCDIIGRVGRLVGISGVTFTIASTGVAGALDAAGEKVALASNFGGQSPNPINIIWTEVSAGGLSDSRVVVLAKSGRGSVAKT